MSGAHQADVGVFGGSGFYALLTGNRHEIKVETPYGAPSDKITLGEIGGRSVAFLPRHGREHTLPPHKINFRANVWAMYSLGVTDIIGPSAVGSLQSHIKPGDFVVCDQFIDRTNGRIDTFYDGPITTHVSSAEPYCPILREHAIAVCRARNLSVHPGGTVVVIQGPRFSTKAESQWFTNQGWDVVGMTQYPECHLARELQMSYANISMVTDYDAGLVDEETSAVTTEAVLEIFNTNIEALRGTILQMIETLPDTSDSMAHRALAAARFD